MIDRLEVEYALRGAVGKRLDPPRAAAFVAPTAQLHRLGFGIPDFEALEAFITDTWELPITIQSDCTIAAIADIVCMALIRRNAA